MSRATLFRRLVDAAVLTTVAVGCSGEGNLVPVEHYVNKWAWEARESECARFGKYWLPSAGGRSYERDGCIEWKR